MCIKLSTHPPNSVSRNLPQRDHQLTPKRWLDKADHHSVIHAVKLESTWPPRWRAAKRITAEPRKCRVPELSSPTARDFHFTKEEERLGLAWSQQIQVCLSVPLESPRACLLKRQGLVNLCILDSFHILSVMLSVDRISCWHM